MRQLRAEKDILGIQKEAAEEQGLHFCTSSHRAEHWFFMGHGKDFDSDIKEPLAKGDFYGQQCQNLIIKICIASHTRQKRF